MATKQEWIIWRKAMIAWVKELVEWQKANPTINWQTATPADIEAAAPGSNPPPPPPPPPGT